MAGMSARIGIAVAYGRLRVVAVRNGSVLWAAEADLDGETRPGGVLRELISRAPALGWRPVANVAIGPSMAQTRALAGLPPIDDAETLARLVQESQGRFFLTNGAPLVTTRVDVIAPGRAWAAAFDGETVRDVVAACEAARLRLKAIAPTVALLGRALEGERIEWHDGPVKAEIAYANGRLNSVRRVPADGHADPASIPRPKPALAAVGEGSWRYADAYAAAVLEADEPLIHRADVGRRSGGRLPRWRVGAAVLLLILSSAAAAIGPPVASHVQARRAMDRITSLAAEREAAMHAQRELARISEVLDDVGSFAAGRRSMTVLLGNLTRALPQHAALSTLRVGDEEGTIMILAPRGTNVVAAIERTIGIADVQIVGPVTVEVIGGRELERTTVGFRLVPPTPGSGQATIEGGGR